MIDRLRPPSLSVSITPVSTAQMVLIEVGRFLLEHSQSSSGSVLISQSLTKVTDAGPLQGGLWRLGPGTRPTSI